MLDKEIIKSYVERIENLMSEKKGLEEDLSDLFTEAKNRGLNVKVLKEIIKIRSKNQAELDAFEDLVDQYKHALGM